MYGIYATFYWYFARKAGWRFTGRSTSLPFMTRRMGVCRMSKGKTEALWAPPGGYVPAYSCLEQKKTRKDDLNREINFPITLLMAWVTLKNISKWMIYSRVHIFKKGPKNNDFLQKWGIIWKIVKYQEYYGVVCLLMFFLKNMEVTRNSTGLSLEKQVEGSARAWKLNTLDV